MGLFARKKRSPGDRRQITVSDLMASGILNSSLRFLIAKAKENGVTKEKMSEALTQLAFYAELPKAWAAFNAAKEVYAGQDRL